MEPLVVDMYPVFVVVKDSIMGLREFAPFAWLAEYKRLLDMANRLRAESGGLLLLAGTPDEGRIEVRDAGENTVLTAEWTLSNPMRQLGLDAA